MKKLLLVLCLAVTSLQAQDIYFCEIGVGGGGAFYLGDANGTLFKNMGPAGEVFFRYKFNGHWVLKAQYEMGNAGIGRFDDVYRSTTFGGLAVGAEINFFDYGVKYYEAFSQTLSHYPHL